jgi:hypothetical protein
MMRKATATESRRIASAFPVWVESGAMPATVHVVTREEWDGAKFRTECALLASARAQIDAEAFCAAGEECDPHVMEDAGSLVAFYYAHGEPVCCLIGCIADAIGGAQ